MIVFQDFGLAIGLGLLVGLERQWSGSGMAGIRTFPLITAFGTLAATLAERYGGMSVAVGMLCVGGMIVASNWAQIRAGQTDSGMTTEVAALVMYAVGAALVMGQRVPALVVTGTLAVLLHAKKPLHELVTRIGPAELRAIIRLALIGLVILPVLPDREFGPYQVINPRRIWAMVVLIVGISLAAYVVYKLLGERRGTIPAGLLGGLISSTAATIGFARRAREQQGMERSGAIMIQLASTVVFGRVLFEIALVAPRTVRGLAPPILAMLLGMAGLAAVAMWRWRGPLVAPARDEPPSDLKGAIVFGGLYALVLLAVALAREHLGPSGLYAVAAISGLTDVDAITLSTAQMVENGQVEAAMGWRVILTGVLSNLLFKGAVVGVLGTPALLRTVLKLFGPALVLGALVLFLWP